MNDMEQLMEKALLLEQQGERDEALTALSQAFDILIDRAGMHARERESSVTDMDALRAIAPRLIEHSNEYLRQNLTAAMILNNMGLLFMELGQFDAAKQKFEESIALAPSGLEYDEPSGNLQVLMQKLLALQPVEEENPLED